MMPLIGARDHSIDAEIILEEFGHLIES